MPVRHWTLLVSMLVPTAALGQANKRDTMVLNDRKAFAEDANWIYNDLAKGFDAAKQSGKPMLVVFR